jgi:hypothetical protein
MSDKANCFYQYNEDLTITYDLMQKFTIYLEIEI